MVAVRGSLNSVKAFVSVHVIDVKVHHWISEIIDKLVALQDNSVDHID